jgi:DnaJ-domain-containing protein 1
MMRPTFGQPLSGIVNNSNCRIDLVDGALAVTSPYSDTFVAQLKAAIPASDRKWDVASKRWMVSPSFANRLQGLILLHYGVTVSLPQATGRAPQNEMRLLDVRYIGAAKQREDGTETAFGWSAGAWSVIFPKGVLLEWFGQTARPDEAITLYGVLGVSQSADTVELKQAWKRLARSYHPDVCKEPGATEQFHAIQNAYEILGNETKRAKYNAGLQFEAMSKAHTPGAKRYEIHSEWRSPLRCGWLLVEGQARLGRFVVSKVIQWQDITNDSGMVLVTSWAAGDDTFKESWVTA